MGWLRDTSRMKFSRHRKLLRSAPTGSCRRICLTPTGAPCRPIGPPLHPADRVQGRRCVQPGSRLTGEVVLSRRTPAGGTALPFLRRSLPLSMRPRSGWIGPASTHPSRMNQPVPMVCQTRSGSASPGRMATPSRSRQSPMHWRFARPGWSSPPAGTRSRRRRGPPRGDCVAVPAGDGESSLQLRHKIPELQGCSDRRAVRCR